jgi:hypothetical protein
MKVLMMGHLKSTALNAKFIKAVKMFNEACGLSFQTHVLVANIYADSLFHWHHPW